MFLHKSHFGKNFVLEIQVKMFSANQIAVFFNQANLQNKSTKNPVFLYDDTNLHKLKVDQNVLGRNGQKWVRQIW